MPEKKYKRLDVRAIYTDERATYLKLADGRCLTIVRVTEHYSRASFDDVTPPQGAVHAATPNEILNSTSLAF